MEPLAHSLAFATLKQHARLRTISPPAKITASASARSITAQVAGWFRWIDQLLRQSTRKIRLWTFSDSFHHWF